MAEISNGLFGGAANFTQSTDKRIISDEIRRKQVFAAGLVWINVILVNLCFFISLVPGACLGGPVVSFSAMPHIVWLIPTNMLLFFVGQSLYLDSNNDYTATAGWLMVSFWFQFLLIAVNVVSLVGIALEISQQTSTFYLQQNAAWIIVLIVAFSIFILWEIWIAYRLWVLRSDMLNAVSLGWRPGTLLDDLENRPAPATPANEGTPLLPANAKVSSQYGAAATIAANSSVPTIRFAAPLRVGGNTKTE